MIIESTLSRQEFTRHALTRHFRRPGFYVYAFVAAVLSAYAFFQASAPPLLLVAAWLPLLVYAVGGWVSITRRSRDESLPIYLPTRYEIRPGGIEVSSRQGRSALPWEGFRAWGKVSGLYELSLTTGQLLVISARALSQKQAHELEQTLSKRIKPKPEPGVFDT
jgi:hypothetical protein